MIEKRLTAKKDIMEFFFEPIQVTENTIELTMYSTHYLLTKVNDEWINAVTNRNLMSIELIKAVVQAVKEENLL